jgi:predicted dehydrogenase
MKPLPMKTPRRQFLQTTALVASAVSVVSPHVLGRGGEKPPSEKLNVAGIGVGGMGRSNLKRCADENIVALCDVDTAYAAKTHAEYPRAKTYRDFRALLAQQKDVEAVIVATPDHSHAVIALAAIRAGKHVYVQKPMTHSVHEARVLTEAAREHKVATQMGNQGHSGDGTRLVREWIQSGTIGAVREVQVWTNRPVWPQGVEVERPKETPPVPEGLDWDLWLGPAPVRPFHPAYVPGNWRAWWDFGTGALGDLGCHLLDAPFWALDLKYPTSVEGCISTYWHDLWKKTEPRNESFPRSTVVCYQFPARGGMPPVKLTWWDGGLLPPRPDILEPDEELGDADGGVIFQGDKGVLICGCYGRSPRVFPEEKMRDLARTPQKLETIPGGLEGHEKDWLRSCKGGKRSSANFDYAGPLTEMVLMGNLAVRHPNRKLLWDGDRMEVTNDRAANSYVRRQYRQGWSL